MAVSLRGLDLQLFTGGGQVVGSLFDLAALVLLKVVKGFLGFGALDLLSFKLLGGGLMGLPLLIDLLSETLDEKR